MKKTNFFGTVFELNPGLAYMFLLSLNPAKESWTLSVVQASRTTRPFARMRYN
jgi:hypothetical protein